MSKQYEAEHGKSSSAAKKTTKFKSKASHAAKTKKHWKVPVIALSCLCVVLLAAGAIFLLTPLSSIGPEDAQGNLAEIMAGTEDKETADGEDAAEATEGDPAETETKTEEGSTGTSVGGFSGGSAGGSGSSAAGAVVPDEEQSTVVTFPYAIPGTELTIEKVASYTGVYLEDGSDKDISGVSTMVLVNHSKSAAEYVDITLNCDGKALEFVASAVPSGATVVVQEANQASYQNGTYSDCTAQVASLDKFELSESQVKVEDNGDNSLTVTNLTGSDIPVVRVFYKYYMDDSDAYVGGIAYTAKLTNLKANGSQKITPSHFSSSGSKVLMVRTYDSDS